MQLRHSIVLAISLGLLCVSGTACRRSEAEVPKPAPAPLTVTVTQPHQGEIYRSIALPATVQPYQQVTLYAKVAGYLKIIRVDKGDAVKEGDVLAEIEVPEMAADLNKYKAELELAKIDFQRVSDASRKAPDLVVPQTADAARARLEVAKANLERIETLLKYTRIVAPFSGVITRRWVDPGAFIPAATSGSAAQNAALVSLVDSSKVRVQVAIPEAEVGYIAKGTPMQITVEELPGRTFEGQVTRDSHVLDASTKTLLAEMELPNSNSALRPGMYVNARVRLEKRTNVWLVPVPALVMEKTGPSLFTISGNRARKVPVKTGFNDGSFVEVTQGVAANEPLIMAGKLALADGQPVRVEGK